MESRDFEYLNTLLSDKKIADAVSDDASPKPGTFDIHIFDVVGAHLFMVTIDQEQVGMFYFYPVTPGVWDMHTLMTEKCRGKSALIAGRTAIAMMFTTYNAVNITGRCPHTNLPSIVFAAHLGFKHVKTAQDWVKRGFTYMSTYYEITRNHWEELCHS